MTEPTLLLLIAVLWAIMLVSAQEFTTSTSPTIASTQESPDLLRNYREITALSMDNRRGYFRSCSAQDKSNLWRIHLALELVKHRELNQVQARVILDAISLASSEFFTSTNGTPPDKTKRDDAVQSLTQRALSVFPKNEAAELFANIGEGKAEDSVLKKYEDISTLPLNKRRALFRNLSPNDKSDLWRTHLALFLVKRPDLNEWQKGIILAAASLAVPEFFDVQSRDAAWPAKVGEPLRSLEQQIVVAFSREDGAKIFGTLGDYVESANRNLGAGSVVLNGINYKQPIGSGPYNLWTHSRFAAQDSQLEQGACQCSTSSDWCPIGTRCIGGSCNATQDGCGTLWSFPCNGASCQ